MSKRDDKAGCPVSAPDRVREALAANERDRTLVARCVTALDKAISARLWLTEGRGSYEWDDDRYRSEFGHAIKEIREAVEPLRAVARDMAHCPTTDADVQAARAALAAPASATGSGAAPTRDAVAEVLLHEAHPDLAPWSLLQLSGPNAAGIVAAVALARRQSDAVMARWPGAATGPRDEAVVAWVVMDRNDCILSIYTDRANADTYAAAADEWASKATGETAAEWSARKPFRVVALVPQRQQGGAR